MHYACIFFDIGCISAEISIFNYPRYSSNMPKVRWALSYERFQHISYAFQQCKNFENRLRFDKVTESLKEGTFLRHSVVELRHTRDGCNISGLCVNVITPSTPAVPNCCYSKGSAPYWSNPPFLIFDIRARWRSSVLSARAPECQKL